MVVYLLDFLVSFPYPLSSPSFSPRWKEVCPLLVLRSCGNRELEVDQPCDNTKGLSGLETQSAHNGGKCILGGK